VATELAPGLIHHPGFLDAAARARLAAEIAAILEAAPPVTPRMPRTGKPFSVRMTNAGPLGWVSDISGYRYQPTHPKTGHAWPPLPPTARAAWEALAAYPVPPEACLINLYAPGTRMGLHQDRDEADLAAPVLSLSLGAAALFRYGGLNRSDPTRSMRLQTGDALVIGGASRLIYHGIDRLYPSADLLDEEGGLAFLPPGGRCNLTLRRVTAAGGAGR
jgi:alkylated DNA repair protein (DNA oxidative demethylase)